MYEPPTAEEQLIEQIQRASRRVKVQPDASEDVNRVLCSRCYAGVVYKRATGAVTARCTYGDAGTGGGYEVPLDIVECSAYNDRRGRRQTLEEMAKDAQVIDPRPNPPGYTKQYL